MPDSAFLETNLAVPIKLPTAPTGTPPSKPAPTPRWPLGGTCAGWKVDKEGAQPPPARPRTPTRPNVIAISVAVRAATPHGITEVEGTASRAPRPGLTTRGGAMPPP